MHTPPPPPRPLVSQILPLLSVLAAAAGLAGCGAADPAPPRQPEVWRFAIEESEGSVQHEYALRFKELIEQRTDGQVEVVVYPYGTLGTSTHMTEQLNLGVIQFAMASPGILGKFIPEMQVFLLHFTLSEDERRNRDILSDPELIADLDPLYAPKGLRLLSIYSEGEMVWTTHQPVRKPEDFAGVKFRVMTSPLLLAGYDAYGASATPMPYSEVYSGLQLGQIDGQVNPVFAIERQKFHEVTSWMTFPRHASFITTCAANRRFLDNLPSGRRALVEEVIAELDEFIFDVQTRFQTERLIAILEDVKRKRGELHLCGHLDRFLASLTDEQRRELIDENPFVELVPGLTDAERDAFRQASRRAREVFLEIGGSRAGEVLERLESAVRQLPRDVEGDGPDPAPED
jgi:TRAP-type C4-dicarboxylate transport system substrate-binding protein